MQLVVLGAGMMGTALGAALTRSGHDVDIVGTHLDGAAVEALRRDRTHPRLAARLPDGLAAHPLEALDALVPRADGVVLGVSSAGVEWAAGALSGCLAQGVPLLMVTKGLRWEGGRLHILPDVLRDGLPPRLAGTSPVAVAGPCIATELAREVPTLVVFTGRDPGLAAWWSQRARNANYHPRPHPDAVGIEVCAALKNAYAMGIALGIGLNERHGGSAGSVAWHNVEAACFAQSVRELRTIVRLAGGDPDVAWGLAGVGDLDVTCNGGRTGRFGRLLGLGLGRDRAIAAMEGATLECLEILEVMRTAIAHWDATGQLPPTELPLLRHLAEVALDGAPVDLPLDRFEP